MELRTYADCEIVALDCSFRSVAHAQRKLRSVLPDVEFARVCFVVGDIMDLQAGVGIAEKGFDLVVCCGVLHHLHHPELGLKRLASVLIPGGVLQLATYSRLSVDGWHNLVRRHLRAYHNSKQLFSSTGAVLRSPTKEEVRAIRANILSLPAGNDLRDNLVNFEEFYTYAGILDLLFHPLETCYTLLEVENVLLRSSGLCVIGIFFPDVNNDLRARRHFREVYGAKDDAHMTSLERWHALEVKDPDLFGRMHTIFLQSNESADVHINCADPPAGPTPSTSVHMVPSSSASESQGHKEESLHAKKRPRTN